MELIILVGGTCLVLVMVATFSIFMQRQTGPCNSTSNSDCEEDTIAYLLSMDNVSIEEAFSLIQQNESSNLRIEKIVRLTLRKLCERGQLNDNISNELIDHLNQYYQKRDKIDRFNDLETAYFDAISILDIAYRFRRENENDEVRQLFDSKQDIRHIIDSYNTQIFKRKNINKNENISNINQNSETNCLAEINTNITVFDQKEEQKRFQRFINAAIFYKKLLNDRSQ